MYGRKTALSHNSLFFRLPETLLFVVSCEGRILEASEAWEQTLGVPLEALLGSRYLDRIHPEDRERVGTMLANVCGEMETARFPARCRRIDEGYIGLSWSVVADRTAGLIYASAHETALDLQSRDGAVPDAYLDTLTGLPNRALFLNRVEYCFERNRRRDDYRFAVLDLGLDRFKVINDSLGHRVGDVLLSHVATTLLGCIRPTDMVARLGGDEFAILLEDIQDPASAVRVVNRVHERLRLPFTLHEHEVYTSATVGIAVSADGYTHPDQYVRDANIAMYRAKSQGGGSYVLFDKTMHEQALHRLELEMDLRRAVERGEFQPYFQPIVTLPDGRLTGFEALVRWMHPGKGLVSPMEFIPIAEETGLIVPIGTDMLRMACRQARQWAEEFPGFDFTVSVNLSPKQLRDTDLPRHVGAILDETGFAPHCLKLEITEGAVMENTEQALVLLGALKSMNIQLSLDDFGTGYSSLSYLHRLPIDVLKIDRSFIRDVDTDQAARSFVETIVNLARQLRLKVICEGIETEAQARVLSEMGCEYGQGFLYSRPVAENEARILLCNEAVA
ncbi:MAG: GGDEF domain-containing protein [Chromatiales bacterium]|jgi:diguanylate cyclase (GGDEF)-like protein|nr:GGDEF domain-containing protein [Chromatiales bacterium]MDX9767477.1 GGDEF domain-containing protein [Ectothiorhodospiraceae bacterium]